MFEVGLLYAFVEHYVKWFANQHPTVMIGFINALALYHIIWLIHFLNRRMGVPLDLVLLSATTAVVESYRKSYDGLALIQLATIAYYVLAIVNHRLASYIDDPTLAYMISTSLFGIVVMTREIFIDAV